MIWCATLIFLGRWALIVLALIFHFQQYDHLTFFHVVAHVKIGRTMEYPCDVTWGRPITCLAFRESSSAILSSNAIFFYGLIKEAGIYFTFNKCSFKCCANMFSLLCRSSSKGLVISSSLAPLHFVYLSPIFSQHFIFILVPYPIVSHLSWCQYDHIINDLGIHLLCCLCRSEFTVAHDMLRNIIATIAWESGAHIQRVVFHIFPHHTQRWMDIVITKDNFWTLANVIIGDLIHTNLVQCALVTTVHATIVTIQNKARSYTKWTLRNDFIPLVIETYSCFHLHFDSFFTSCVHACIARHRQTSLVLSMFIFHYRQWVSIAL